MPKKISNLFILLVVIQALHSIEEYLGRLWEVFPPAVWLTGLISSDKHFAFLVINIGLFVFGLLSWFLLVKKDHYLAQFIIWFWIVIELINGVGHPVWSIMQGRYTPGVITAPFLFVTSVFLIRAISKSKLNSAKI